MVVKWGFTVHFPSSESECVYFTLFVLDFLNLEF